MLSALCLLLNSPHLGFSVPPSKLALCGSKLLNIQSLAMNDCGVSPGTSPLTTGRSRSRVTLVGLVITSITGFIHPCIACIKRLFLEFRAINCDWFIHGNGTCDLHQLHPQLHELIVLSVECLHTKVHATHPQAKGQAAVTATYKDTRKQNLWWS